MLSLNFLFKIMILELIAVLGIKVIFTETPKIDCGYKNTNGCYYNNTIYLSYQSQDLNHTLYHELGHALFNQDKLAQKIIKDYPPLKNYSYYAINGYDPYKEMVADYFAEYSLNNKEFSVNYPCLYIYFKDKLQEKLLYI